ncbi:MAG: secondary thiamine-phosphate synthase enzyme YjbQ [Candidatus Methanomethylicia archaeon]
MTKIVAIESTRRVEFIDITRKIEELIDENIEEGLCNIYSPHTTAGLTINENYDPSVVKDIIETLEVIVPENREYNHVEGNAPAHIKTCIIGNSLTIPINNGKLMLGRWQGIFLCEFDGPRKRNIYVTIIPIKK